VEHFFYVILYCTLHYIFLHDYVYYFYSLYIQTLLLKFLSQKFMLSLTFWLNDDYSLIGYFYNKL